MDLAITFGVPFGLVILFFIGVYKISDLTDWMIAVWRRCRT